MNSPEETPGGVVASSQQSPAKLGYRMPAEWEPHEATWLSWPRPDGISFPDSYDRVTPVLAKMVDALAGSESVHINVMHSYTSRQELVDAPHKDFRRGRAAAESIIPVPVDLAPTILRTFAASSIRPPKQFRIAAPGLSSSLAYCSSVRPESNRAHLD